MSPEDQEDQLYQEDVEAVKKWWSDPRWRYTKRPFTADQIVAKRGSLKINYPSNEMSKKLWNIIEGRFKVCRIQGFSTRILISFVRTGKRASPMAVWSRRCSHKWRSTWILSMSPAGSVRRRHHLQMNLRQILPTTPWYVFKGINRKEAAYRT